MKQDHTPISPSPDESADKARRAFLEKAGKLAVYTPPTMLALMYPGLHAVASGWGVGERREDWRERREDWRERRRS
jgi:hypothetical protein